MPTIEERLEKLEKHVSQILAALRSLGAMSHESPRLSTIGVFGENEEMKEFIDQLEHLRDENHQCAAAEVGRVHES